MKQKRRAAVIFIVVGSVLLLIGVPVWLANWAARQERQNEALLRAASRGDDAKVRILLAQGADPNARAVPRPPHRDWLALLRSLVKPPRRASQSDFPTPLILAILRRHLETARILIEAGADPNARYRHKAGTEADTPLSVAILTEDLRFTDLLLRHGASVNAHDASDNTPLMLAVQPEDRVFGASLVNALLARGADASAKNRAGNTAFAIICEPCRYYRDDPMPPRREQARAQIFDVLRARCGGDVNASASKRDIFGNPIVSERWPMLVDNVQARDAEMTAILLARGAKPNAVSASRQSALMFAAVKGQTEMVRTLLAHGANPNARDKWGNQPIINAARYGFVDTVRLLLDHGANPNAHTNVGWTALMAAAQSGNEQIVRWLVERGANVNARTKEGETALMDAAANGDLASVQLLVKHGADCRARTRKGVTVLECALGYEMYEFDSHSEEDRYVPGIVRTPGNVAVLRYIALRLPLAERRHEVNRIGKMYGDDASNPILKILRRTTNAAPR